jgi:hypothetical protein
MHTGEIYCDFAKTFDWENHEILLNSVAISPQANYTDRATAACRRS